MRLNCWVGKHAFKGQRLLEISHPEARLGQCLGRQCAIELLRLSVAAPAWMQPLCLASRHAQEFRFASCTIAEAGWTADL